MAGAADGATFDDINPADESLVGIAADATADATAGDVSDAVQAARTAFDSGEWATDINLRRTCLRQLAAGLRKAAPDLADLATLEAGIPSSQANLIDSVIEEVEWTIGLMDTFGWETDLPVAEMLGLRSSRRVRQEPRGVVAAITPWNAPASMNVGKTAPALAAGNTVVLKPAPDTPLSAVILAEVIAHHTDIPPGVFNLITSGNNEVGGDGLTGDPRVNMFHFTGSAAVGQRIASRAAIGFRAGSAPAAWRSGRRSGSPRTRLSAVTAPAASAASAESKASWSSCRPRPSPPRLDRWIEASLNPARNG